MTMRGFSQIAADATAIANSPGYTAQHLAIQVHDIASNCEQLDVIHVKQNLMQLFETCAALQSQVEALKEDVAHLKRQG